MITYDKDGYYCTLPIKSKSVAGAIAREYERLYTLVKVESKMGGWVVKYAGKREVKK